MRYNTLLKTILIAALVSLGLVHAGEKVDRTIDVQANGNVEISNVRGIVRIEGWDKNQVSVKGELDDNTKEFIFETNNSTTVIKVELPRGRMDRSDGSNLIIRVPHTNSVDFSGVSSDVVITDIEAGIDIRTVSGDVTAANIASKIHLNSVSGDIDIKDSTGNARLASVSGDIDAKIDSDEIEVSLVSGDTILQLGEFTKLEGSTVNGDIWMQGTQKDGGQTRFSSVNGDVELKYTGTLNATIKAKSGPGGDITNKLTETRVEEIFPNQQKLGCTVGNGDGRISVSTVNGSIKLLGD